MILKDENVEGIQIDNYEINASVTDINGETQSADTQLKVASVSHYIQAEEIKDVFSDENIKLKVETKIIMNRTLKIISGKIIKAAGAGQDFQGQFYI